MADPIAQLCELIAGKLQDEPTASQVALLAHVEGAISEYPELAVALKADRRMLQDNRDGASGYQTLVEGGVANIGTHYHLAEPEKFEAVFAAVLQKLQTPVAKVINFEPYLKSVTKTYEKWWQFYTLTEAESKQGQMQESTPMFDFRLMVETVPKEKSDKPLADKSEKEEVERFSVLDGLRKYALAEKPEHVLLKGQPGLGKSTALARLVLEEATEATTSLGTAANPELRVTKIPVLVELRYWQGSIAQLIVDVVNRHGLSIKTDDLETVLASSLILFDGVNELPSEEARSQLTDFRRNHPNLPMIFTTRDLSLGGDLGIERKLEMLPLMEPQMQQFIHNYIPEQAETMLRQLKDRRQEFEQMPLLPEQTPLLLWMLCEVFQQAPNNQLPSNLGRVLQAFTRTYEESSVRKHEVALLKGDVRPLSDRRLWKKALMVIAARMMQGEAPVDFRVALHPEEVERELSNIFPNEKFPVRDILDDLLKYHLLQNRSTDQIEFRHQLIQEYYAAEYLLKLLPSLTDEQLKQDYLNYLKWTEPVALMLALVSDEAQALRVVKLALEVDWILGARFAGEVQPHFQKTMVRTIIELEASEQIKIELLDRTRSKESIPFLLKVFEDENSDVRWLAAEVLGNLGSETAISALLKVLEETEDPDVRGSATEVLGYLESEAAISGLLKVLEETEESGARESAAEALGNLGSEAAISGLLKALKHLNPDVRRLAAEALVTNRSEAKLRSEAVTYGLLKALEETEDPDVLRIIAKALNYSDSEAAICGLLKFMEHVNPDMRDSATEVLSTFSNKGSEAAISGLLKALEHEDSNVRDSAKHGLGKLRSIFAISSLLKTLEEHDNFTVRSHIALVLHKIRNNKAFNYDAALLVELLEAEKYKVSKALAEGRSTSEAACSVWLEALEKYKYASLREAVIEKLVNLGSDTVIPALIKVLKEHKDDDYYSNDVRDSFQLAVKALAKLGNAAIPALLEALYHKDFLVRFFAAQELRNLGNLGSEAAVSGLFNTLESKDETVLSAVTPAIRLLEIESAIPHLLKALEHKDPFVLSDVLEALGKLGSDNHIENIRCFLDSPERQVSESAVMALGRLGSDDAIPGLLKLLGRSQYDNTSAGELLSKIGNFQLLPQLQQLSQSDEQVLWIISAIQERYRIYNYEIWQASVQNQEQANLTKWTTQPSIADLLAKIDNLQNFLIQLQTQYPNVTTETQALTIIDSKFKEIETKQLTQWQDLLNVKRLWNGGKNAAVKVGEHFTEQNIWGKSFVAFLEGMSEDL
jgi:HEAT repeat protein